VGNCREDLYGAVFLDHEKDPGEKDTAGGGIWSMRKSLWIIALIFAAMGAPTVLRADITYGVDLNVGGDIVMGSITTDGTIGQLNTSDITAFSLSDSENFINLNNTNAGFNGTPVSIFYASQSQLTINPPTPDNGNDFHANTGDEDLDIYSAGGNAPYAAHIYSSTGILSAYSQLPNGTVAGTVPEINPASAPSALALVAGAVLIIRGRRTRKVPAA
jgi:hypothetical protein